MAVYVVTLVIVAIVLVGSYRALGGGGEPATDEQVQEFVGNVTDWVRADAAQLEFLNGDAAITDANEDTARAVRKKLTGYQQQLNRLVETQDERDDLSLAIESLNWACRMTESGSSRVNANVRDAANELWRRGTSLL